MKLRLIHSCMVLGVLALLFCYSAFLTTPQFTDDNSLHGRVDLGLESVQLQQQPIRSDIANAVKHLKETSHEPETPLLNTVDSGDVKEEGSQKHDVSDGDVSQVPSSESQSPPKETKPPPSSDPPIGSSKLLAVKTRDIYQNGFLYSNPSLCPNDGDGLRLFVMIMSAPAHFSARDAIRLTWAHFAQRTDISIAFLIGRSENTTVVEGIEVEKQLYDDLIIANFADSYDNLTLKTMATLEWVETYCNQSEFVLKTDDDMFINMPNLLNFISRIEGDDAKEGKIYGRLAKKWKPVRNKKSKYYISFQQFKKSIYPDFTTGPAYLFATRLASKLFAKGMENTYLKLEDVYTTGLLAQELGIKRMNIGDFANKKVNFHKTGFCALSRLISMHMVAFHEQFELWKKLLDGRTKCKIIYQQPKKATKKEKEVSDSNGGSGTGTSSTVNAPSIGT